MDSHSGSVNFVCYASSCKLHELRCKMHVECIVNWGQPTGVSMGEDCVFSDICHCDIGLLTHR
jgi:hypothetical protein